MVLLSIVAVAVAVVAVDVAAAVAVAVAVVGIEKMVEEHPISLLSSFGVVVLLGHQLCSHWLR